jgi:hypothetical protein
MYSQTGAMTDQEVGGVNNHTIAVSLVVIARAEVVSVVEGGTVATNMEDTQIEMEEDQMRTEVTMAEVINSGLTTRMTLVTGVNNIVVGSSSEITMAVGINSRITMAVGINSRITMAVGINSGITMAAGMNGGNRTVREISCGLQSNMGTETSNAHQVSTADTADVEGIREATDLVTPAALETGKDRSSLVVMPNRIAKNRTVLVSTVNSRTTVRKVATTLAVTRGTVSSREDSVQEALKGILVVAGGEAGVTTTVAMTGKINTSKTVTIEMLTAIGRVIVVTLESNLGYLST